MQHETHKNSGLDVRVWQRFWRLKMFSVQRSYSCKIYIPVCPNKLFQKPGITCWFSLVFRLVPLVANAQVKFFVPLPVLRIILDIPAGRSPQWSWTTNVVTFLFCSLQWWWIVSFPADFSEGSHVDDSRFTPFQEEVADKLVSFLDTREARVPEKPDTCVSHSQPVFGLFSFHVVVSVCKAMRQSQFNLESINTTGIAPEGEMTTGREIKISSSQCMPISTVLSASPTTVQFGRTRTSIELLRVPARDPYGIREADSITADLEPPVQRHLIPL